MKKKKKKREGERERERGIPCDKNGEEDDHGDRVPKEVEEEDEERDEHVVHAV